MIRLKISTNPYIKLLLDCIGGRADKFGIGQISGSAWNALIREALRFDVGPLLYSRLNKLSSSALVPETALESLRKSYFSTAMKNRLIYDDLSEIMRRIGDLSIGVIVLKGAHLAGVVYDDLALRTMTDLDILVRRKDLFSVERTLLGMGYGPVARPGIEEQCAQHHHLIPFIKKGRPPVEVHWNICPLDVRFSIAVDDLWSRARKTMLPDGTPVLLLSPEDLLIHLCLHVSLIHDYAGFVIRNICDISEVIRFYQAEIDWNRLGLIADGFGVTRYISVTLSLAERLLGTEVPTGTGGGLPHEDADAKIVDVLYDYILRRLSPAEIIVRGCLLTAHAALRTDITRRLLNREKMRSLVKKWLNS